MAQLFIFIQQLLPQKLLARLMYCITQLKISWVSENLIKCFIKKYNINLQDSVKENISDYSNFNDFFTREMKDSLRPLSTKKWVSPVDGTIRKIGVIDKDHFLTQGAIEAKGHKYSLTSLLANEMDLVSFKKAKYINIYLSPANCHRIYMPRDGELLSMHLVPGKLFSVNDATDSYLPNLYIRNQRLVMKFRSFGEATTKTWYLVMIGAFFVGSISSWEGEIPYASWTKISSIDYSKTPVEFKKGQYLAHFNMGSTVIMVMQEKDIFFDKELEEGVSLQLKQSLSLE